MPTLDQTQIEQKVGAYLRSHYGEELRECEVLQDELNDDGDGRLVTRCRVRVGGSESLWQKTFTFRNSEIVNMTWKRLG
ncbi:MAG: hypothetical protein GX131_08205 [candidate division WS1 bacterium]|jgi:hypothetical protein|nr:hypothetical protein [candidate division WS1 bacterium]